jgi:hypothetical protein
MRSLFLFLAALAIFPWIFCSPAVSAVYQRKEILTPAEIKKIQDTPEIDERIKIYLEAAKMRLSATEDRLNGKEAEEGDPLEFFTVEDMLDGFYRIYQSVMTNLDDAAQRGALGREQLAKTLKNLKSTCESNRKHLDILKKMAEEKKLEKVWDRVNAAIDINNGALEGASSALGQQPGARSRKPGEK